MNLKHKLKKKKKNVFLFILELLSFYAKILALKGFYIIL